MRPANDLVNLQVILTKGGIYHLTAKERNYKKLYTTWIIRFDYMDSITIHDTGAISLTTGNMYLPQAGTAFGNINNYDIRWADLNERAWFQKCILFNEYTPLEEFKFQIIT